MSAHWLDRLVGDWTFEGRSIPDNPAWRRTGAESVTRRGQWLIIESDDGARFQLAFNPATGRVGGDFVSWDDPVLWTYDGAVENDRLVLNSRGPAFDDPDRETDYQDIWEIVSPDERVLTGRFLRADGAWRDFTRTTCRRKG